MVERETANLILKWTAIFGVIGFGSYMTYQVLKKQGYIP